MKNNVYNDFQLVSDDVINSLARAYTAESCQVATESNIKAASKAGTSVKIKRAPPPIMLPTSQTDRLLRQILDELRGIRAELERQKRVRLS